VEEEGEELRFPLLRSLFEGGGKLHNLCRKKKRRSP